MHVLSTVILSTLGLSSHAICAAQNLIQDGGFETPLIAPAVRTYGFGEAFGPWQVYAGNIEHHGDFAASGLQSVRVTSGVLYQFFPTVPETLYRVTFSRFSQPALLPEEPGLTPPTSVNVGWLSLGGTGGDVVIDEPLVGDIWESHSYTFLAKDPWSVLYFGTYAGSEVFVDDVSVTVALEPGFVPCDGLIPGRTWKDHGEYISALVQLVQESLSEGLLTKRDAEVILSTAAHSDCGVSRRIH